MCGIAGSFNFDSSAPSGERTRVLGLNQLQKRRGPDSGGFWTSKDERVVLGHRRLAIIDPGADGNQPMSDVSGRWTVTFNGEIYNYRALRQELEQLGYRMRTNSDTEVLINVIAHWGEAGLRKLRGMYAFALWDDFERELWLVRDPYGIKPLYLSERNGVLWFASQARALTRGAPVETGRDPAALVGFYLWGHVPEPFTWWAGIHSLPAGHVQRVRAGKSLTSARPFAKIEQAYVHRPPQILEQGELRRLVHDSVRHHLVADVPVGVFLSGGIDSNVVAALAAEATSNLQTVTLAFDEFRDTKDDEAARAEETSRHLGTRHTTVRMGRAEFEVLFDDFMTCMDQPTIDGLNVYLVSHIAAQLGLKVALSGLGGDELFGGYPSFRKLPTLVKWGRHFSFLEPFWTYAEKALRTIALPGVHPKAAGMPSCWGSLPQAYLLLRGLYLVGELELLLDESWINEGIERLKADVALTASLSLLREAGAPEHAQVAALESCWYLRNQLLRDTDWASMAHGVEVRVPLVDFALLEAIGPAIASVRPPNKRDLAACWDRIPQSIVSYRKTAFSTPVRRWIVEQDGAAGWGLRKWAGKIHRRFRFEAGTHSSNFPIKSAA